jgi:hypothetical protein
MNAMHDIVSSYGQAGILWHTLYGLPGLAPLALAKICPRPPARGG